MTEYAACRRVVVVPRARAPEVAHLAQQIDETEAAIHARLAKGSTLAQARAALCNHTLQRKEQDRAPQA